MKGMGPHHTPSVTKLSINCTGSAAVSSNEAHDSWPGRVFRRKPPYQNKEWKEHLDIDHLVWAFISGYCGFNNYYAFVQLDKESDLVVMYFTVNADILDSNSNLWWNALRLLLRACPFNLIMFTAGDKKKNFTIQLKWHLNTKTFFLNPNWVWLSKILTSVNYSRKAAVIA